MNRSSDQQNSEEQSRVTEQVFGQRIGRRRFLATTGKALAATTGAGLLTDAARRSALAKAIPPFTSPLPYAPFTPATADETASWFNPKTDAKWLKNPITVHVSSWWAPQPEIAGAELAFNKIFTPKTGITVVYDYIGTNYNAVVLTKIAAGDPYDVITFNADSVGPYVDKGILTPIEPYIKRDNYDLSDFFPWALQEFTYKGQLVGLSDDVGGYYLYYNEDLLRKAGITPPSPTTPWTWNELLAAAKKLTIKQGSHVTQWGLDTSDMLGSWFGNNVFARMNGTDLFNADATQILLDDPRVIKAFRFFYDMIYTYKVSPPPGAVTPSSFDAFAAGGSALLLDGSWGIDAFRYQEVKTPWNISFLPVGPSAGSQVHPFVFAAGWTIPRGVKDPDASWVTMKFYASKYFSDHVMGRILSSLPSRKSELEHPAAYSDWPAAQPSGLTQTFETKYMNAASYSPGTRIAFSNAVTASLNKLALIWTGKNTPESLLPGLAKEINSELKQG